MLNNTFDTYGHHLPRYYRGNPFHPRGNSATGHSIPVVLLQVSPAKPWDSRGYCGITAVPITAQGSSHNSNGSTSSSGKYFKVNKAVKAYS